MTALDSLTPLIYKKFTLYSKNHLKNAIFCNQIRVSQYSPLSPLPNDTCHPARVPSGFMLGGFSRKGTLIRAKSSEAEKVDTDVAEERPGTDPMRKEKEGRAGEGWWRPPWLPILREYERGVFLIQLSILIFLARLFRFGVPLPGSEIKIPTLFKNVSYSEFLNRVDGDQVHKAEVDDVHIMFKLKPVEGGSVERESSSSLWKSYGSVLKRVLPTEQIVYTTTRPKDVKTPYKKMRVNSVEFGSPDKRSDASWKSALVGLLYAGAITLFLYPTPSMIIFAELAAENLLSRNSEDSDDSEKKITFADVAGIDEAKEELEEIVEFLRNPSRYTRLGARPPRGVLLVGLPGTGKTLLAKAVAGEANVPFISCSASEFVELYAGMGASRVRDLFARAKKQAPSIIFIDEIDSVGKIRDSRYRSGSNDEREQTLNQLLTEMDGFDSNSAVIVLGATNRADVLDPALRRPGRFDRLVMVETPDRIGRESILEVHVSSKALPLAEDIDLSDIASMTTGFTGADLANLVNEAALLAGRQSKLVVEKIDFINSVERSLAGIEKKTARLQGIEKAVVARHEAGHAVVGTAIAKLLPGQPRVEKLSILPRSGGTLGFAYTPPASEDRCLLFVDELRGRLVTLLGGRAAEEIIYAGRVSTGALDDIRRATDIAYKAVAEYGLSHTIGPISLTALSGGGDRETMSWGGDQGHLADLVQGEVKALLQYALEVALSVVRANATILEGLGAYLEEKEKVEGEDLQEWLRLVVAPAELVFFISGKQQSLLEAGS